MWVFLFTHLWSQIPIPSPKLLISVSSDSGFATYSGFKYESSVSNPVHRNIIFFLLKFTLQNLYLGEILITRAYHN